MGGHHVVPFPSEQEAQHVQQVCIIFYDQDRHDATPSDELFTPELNRE
jgi:hypothetical protein